MKNINFVLKEIDKHKERLEYVVNKMKSWSKLDIEILDVPEKVEILDAF